MPLQHSSKRLNRSAVSTVLKETSRVSGGDRIERLTHGLYQRFSAPGLRLTKKAFNLREGLFNGTKVRRVRRQVKQLAARVLDEFLHPFTLVGREVVHHHHLPLPKARNQNSLDVGLEDDPVGRALHCQARPPLPSTVMLASSMILGPRLRGTKQCALAPLGDQA